MLARAGELLSSSLDYERTLQQVAELAVPQLADWCVVSMPDGHGYIRGVAVAHVDPTKVGPRARASRSAIRRGPTRRPGTAQVMRDGRSQLVNEIPEEMLTAVAQDDEHLELLRSVGLHAGLTVPMSTGAKIVGALTLISAESARRFDDGRRRARRGACAARRHRGRERAPVQPSDRTSRARCRRACCRAGCRRCRAGRRRRCTGPPATRTGSAATSTTRSPCAAAGWRSSATSPAAAPRRRP